MDHLQKRTINYLQDWLVVEIRLDITNLLLDILVRDKILDSKDTDIIQSKATNADKVRELLYILKRVDGRLQPFSCLVKALEVDFPLIASALRKRHDDVRRSECGVRTDACDHQCLYCWLCDRLLVSRVADNMVAREVITDQQARNLCALISEREACQQLLKILISKPDSISVHAEFCNILQSFDKFLYLADRLNKFTLGDYCTCTCSLRFESEPNIDCRLTHQRRNNVCSKIKNHDNCYPSKFPVGLTESDGDISHPLSTNEINCSHYQPNGDKVGSRWENRHDHLKIDHEQKEYYLHILDVQTAPSETSYQGNHDGEGSLTRSDKTLLENRPSVEGCGMSLQEDGDLLHINEGDAHNNGIMYEKAITVGTTIDALPVIPRKNVTSDVAGVTCIKSLWNYMYKLKDAGKMREWRCMQKAAIRRYRKVSSTTDIEVMMLREELCQYSLYNVNPHKVKKIWTRLSTLLPGTSFVDWHKARSIALVANCHIQTGDMESAKLLLSEARDSTKMLGGCMSAAIVNVIEGMYWMHQSHLQKQEQGNEQGAELSVKTSRYFLQLAIENTQQEKVFDLSSYWHQIYLFLAFLYLQVDVSVLEFESDKLVSLSDLENSCRILDQFERLYWDDATPWTKALYFICRSEEFRLHRKFTRALDYAYEAEKQMGKAKFSNPKNYVKRCINYLKCQVTDAGAIDKHIYSTNCLPLCWCCS